MAHSTILLSDPPSIAAKWEGRERLSNLDSRGIAKNMLRICVLNSSYEGSDSAMKDFDDLNVGPHNHLTQSEHLKVDVYPIKKATAYRQIRSLASGGKYDVFFNMCDGGKDEDRAGEEVVRALEEFKVPFTGALSRYYEFTKPDMKMMAEFYGIRTARHAIVENMHEVERKCSRLQFPVIVKHQSGYSSVGMTRDSKCYDMANLVARVAAFIEEYQAALIEEFIDGDEVTVLACGDDTHPDGVRVFQPVMMTFPEGEDFKHFDLKWVGFDGMGWIPLPHQHKAYDKIVEMGRKAFKIMMAGVGYGRTDIRIDRHTGEPVFLELNPNCGCLYPQGQEASTDWILKLDPTTNHQDFIMTQIRMAIQRHSTIIPKCQRDWDPVRGYHLRASCPITKGTVIFYDEGKPHRIVTKPHVTKTWDSDDRKQFEEGAWPLGTDKHVYAIWDYNPAEWRPLIHSCDPNITFDINRSLNVIALRDIDRGEELTMDYATLCDDTMPPFDCVCSSPSCRKRVVCGTMAGGMSPYIASGHGAGKSFLI